MMSEAPFACTEKKLGNFIFFSEEEKNHLKCVVNIVDWSAFYVMHRIQTYLTAHSVHIF